MRPDPSHGFTLIEVVIAIALTALIVASVYAATNSMTGVARRQQESGTSFNRESRFREILESDLHGWSVAQTGASSGMGATISQPNPNEILLLDITTTTDGFAQAIQSQNKTPAGQDRAVHVQYVCRNYLEGFELVRREVVGDTPLELSLLKLTQPAKMEFWSGSAWSDTPPPDHGRPKALRLTLDGTPFVIRL